MQGEKNTIICTFHCKKQLRETIYLNQDSGEKNLQFPANNHRISQLRSCECGFFSPSSLSQMKLPNCLNLLRGNEQFCKLHFQCDTT